MRKRMITAIVSAIAAFGMCTGVAATANAYIQYPVSKGNTNIGYYQASWDVTPTKSDVTGYSFSRSHYCRSVQDRTIVRYQSASKYTQCHTIANGTQAAHEDWVEYSYQ